MGLLPYSTVSGQTVLGLGSNRPVSRQTVLGLGSNRPVSGQTQLGLCSYSNRKLNFQIKNKQIMIIRLHLCPCLAQRTRTHRVRCRVSVTSTPREVFPQQCVETPNRKVPCGRLCGPRKKMLWQHGCKPCRAGPHRIARFLTSFGMTNLPRAFLLLTTHHSLPLGRAGEGLLFPFFAANEKRRARLFPSRLRRAGFFAECRYRPAAPYQLRQE